MGYCKKSHSGGKSMSVQTLLADLVKIPSYSGHEHAVAAFIMDWARIQDIKAQLQNGNVLLQFISSSNKALIFNAHMDTVKPGNENLWTYPPSGKDAGVTMNGKLYGLGASDDKAAIAAFLCLAIQLQKTPPPIDVIIVFVANEEVDGSGSQSFVNYFQKKYAHTYKDVAAVLGEPTDLNTIEIGHRGNIFIKVTTSGDTGHGSQPQNIKTHAIMENINAIEKITTLGKSLSEMYSDPVLGKPSFCLTGIHSDTSSPNTVSSGCSSTWDIRTTPNVHSKVVSLIQKTLGKHVEITHLGEPAPFGITAPDSKIVRLLQKLVPDVKVAVSPGSNDICAFTSAAIPAVAFGPGQKDTIHKPNEYVQLHKVIDAVDLYKQLIYSW